VDAVSTSVLKEADCGCCAWFWFGSISHESARFVPATAPAAAVFLAPVDGSLILLGDTPAAALAS
jgi:hypothetical protein